jgi:DNA-binding PadR family transcriptional regulator
VIALLKFGLLGLLKNQPLSGYEIVKLFQEQLFFVWTPQTSQIYRDLDAMKKKGWIAADTIQQEKRPNKNVFTMTESGLAVYQTWRSQLSAEQMLQPHDPWLLWLLLSDRENAPATLQLLEQYRVGCLHNFQTLSATGGNKNPAGIPTLYWKLGVEYRKQQYLASIRWADYAIRIVKELGQTDPG